MKTRDKIIVLIVAIALFFEIYWRTGISCNEPDEGNGALWSVEDGTYMKNEALWSDRNGTAVKNGGGTPAGANKTDSRRQPLRVLFGSTSRLLSQVLRNQMIASLISIHFKDRVKVTILDIDSVVARSSKSGFDVCVGTKAYIAKFPRWCHQQGAVYVHDVVDSDYFMGSRIFSGIERSRREGVKQRFPFPSDLLLVSTIFQRNLLKTHFAVEAVVVPHQHTNMMSVHSPPKRFKDLVAGDLTLPNGKKGSFVGTVGFVSGVNNALNATDLSRLKHTVCCKYKMRLRLINQELRGNNIVSTTWDYACGSSEPVTHTFGTEVPPKSIRRNFATLMSVQDFWEMQGPFHNNSLLAPVDIALLWPPEYSPVMPIVSRPVTRLVHWWSHGTPTIFYPYSAYTETADAQDYYQCDELGLFELRHARSLDVVDKMLNVLLKNPQLRECLSARGLRIAKDYSPERVASHFVKALEEAYRNKKRN